MPTGVHDTNYQLEDYIFEMQCQQNRKKDEPPPDPDDVYSCLAEKESNLILAAELGKALLSKNEVLIQENERMAEEFSRKLEVSYNYTVQLSLLMQTLPKAWGKLQLYRTIIAFNANITESLR